MLKEFKEFAMRGNVVDMAVGIILGVAFGAMVRSMVDDVLMPVIGLVLGGADFSELFVVLRAGEPAGPYATLAEAKAAAAVTLNYGAFINTMVSFLIVAVVLFFLVRGVNALKRQEEAPTAEPTTRPCPYCYSAIPIQATRCPQCTSELQPS